MLNYRKGSYTMERTKLKLKPESYYYISNCTTKTDVIEAFLEQKALTGRVVGYDAAARTLTVCLGNEIYATMDWDEATIYPFRYPKVAIAKNVPREIFSLIHRKVRVKVNCIDGDHIYVSRKDNMIEVFKQIQKEIEEYPERIYSGRIIGKYKYGVFYDIGEGILAFCHISEYTSIYIRELTAWSSIGEKSDVKIVKCEDNYKINCSRKQAEEKRSASLYKKYDVVLIKLSEPLYENHSITGYFAEVNPVIAGIADNGEGRQYRSGDIVTAIVKKVDAERNQVNLIIIDG